MYYALGHNTRGSVTYAGVDMATGEMVAIIEWSFKLKPKNSKNMTYHDPDSKSSSDLTDYMKQVNITVTLLCLSVNMHISVGQCLINKFSETLTPTLLLNHLPFKVFPVYGYCVTAGSQHLCKALLSLLFAMCFSCS